MIPDEPTETDLPQIVADCEPFNAYLWRRAVAHRDIVMKSKPGTDLRNFISNRETALIIRYSISPPGGQQDLLWVGSQAESPEEVIDFATWFKRK